MKRCNVEVSERFKKEFRKLDKHTQKLLKGWIDKHLLASKDPLSKGKALTGNRKSQWRYRIGAYRLICLIADDRLIILALTIGHRKDIYT